MSCIDIVFIGIPPVANHFWEISTQVTADQQAICLLSPRDEAGNRLQARGGRAIVPQPRNLEECKVHSGSPWSFGNRSNSYATVSKSTWKAYNAIWNGRVSNIFEFENYKNQKKTSKIKIDISCFFLTPKIIRCVSTNIFSLGRNHLPNLPSVSRFHFRWIRRHSFVGQWWKKAKCCHPNKHQWCWFVPWGRLAYTYFDTYFGYPQPGTRWWAKPKIIEAREVVWKYQLPKVYFQVIYICIQICRYMKVMKKLDLGYGHFMSFSVLHGIQRFCKVEIAWHHVIDFVDRILSAFSFPIFRQDATRQGPFGIGGHRWTCEWTTLNCNRCST